jgi:transposase
VVVRLVLEHRGNYASEYEAIRTIAERMSLKSETVRVWARKAETGGWRHPGCVGIRGGGRTADITAEERRAREDHRNT